MQWGSVSEFLQMGGYAPFVWGAYGVTAALIAWEILAVRARKRRAEREAARQARLDAVRGERS
ncbi:MAG: heme exporter protein CcmD [Burkholderiaceae bacterium]|nr:heme exporter protein CcmD [Burkholderiaceae bacterium]